MKNVMVDLETLGTYAGCVVLSIGAVKFDSSGLGEEFYVEISQSSSAKHGLRADMETVKWWSEQSNSARQVLARTENDTSALPLTAALVKFGAFLPGNSFIWGNGASFDNTILEECFRRTAVKMPWGYYNDRCYRTLKNLAPDVKLERLGTFHNALDDARSQAAHAVAILRHLGVSL